MKQYVEEPVTARDSSSASEYMRELARTGQKRNAKEQLERTLLESWLEGEAQEATPEFWSTLRTEWGKRTGRRARPAAGPPEMAEIFVRARARREILPTTDSLLEHGGVETDRRFLDATQSPFEALAKRPKLGVVCAFQSAAHRHSRRWPVKGFENWLIFYQSRRNGVETFISLAEPVTMSEC